MNASATEAMRLRSRRRSATPMGLWGGASGASSPGRTPSSAASSRAIADSRVDERVGDVDEDAGEDERGRAEERYRHDHVVVAAADRLERQPADARYAGQRLDEERALPQPAQREGARVARPGRHRRQRQRDDGDHYLAAHSNHRDGEVDRDEEAPGDWYLIVSVSNANTLVAFAQEADCYGAVARPAARRQPAQLQREGEEEERHEDQPRYRLDEEEGADGGRVGPRPLTPRREDAERYPQPERDDQRDAVQLERAPDGGEDDLRDLAVFVAVALSQVAPRRVLDVDPVLLVEGLVEAARVADAVQHLRVAELAGGDAHRVARPEARQREGDEGDDEEDQRHPQEAPQQVGDERAVQSP